MPKILGNSLQVFPPLGYSNKSKQIACKNGRSNRTIQEVIGNKTNPSKTKYINELCGNLQVLGTQKSVLGRRESGMVYGYAKLCKTINYLPNPMSKLFYDNILYHKNGKLVQQVKCLSNNIV